MNITKTVDILLVEDSLSDAEMIIRAFKKSNPSSRIVHLEDGAKAVDFIFARGDFSGETGECPKMILLDLHMPKINGLEVLTHLRSHSRTRNTPVVVFSSSKEDSDVKKCYELGVNSYIVKPVEFQEFTQTIFTLGKYWLEYNQPAP